MSVPDTNALPPAPFRMKTRMSGSVSTFSQAATSASYMAHVIALRACGRLKVSTANGGSIWKMVSAVVIEALRISAMDQTRRSGALAGLRVIDLTQVMAGPFCTMLLADLGADVVKIEPPSGDSTRTMPGAVGTDSPSFNAVNRGKRSVVINLKSADGVDTRKRLARSADILVENYRPGVMAAMGLDYTSLASANPRLIYASISGYGHTGPMKNRGGFDLVAQGVSGIMSVTGEPGGAPVKSGIPLTDLGAALFAVVGILAALEHRHATGRGQHVDTSLLDAGVGLSVWEATQYFSGRGIPERLGSAHRMSAPYQAFKCADGFITIGGANDRSFRRICEVLDHPEWADAPEFKTDGQRIRNREEL